MVATLGSTPRLEAQQEGTTNGSPASSRGAIWWSLGGGGGSVRITGGSSVDGEESGLALHLGVGATAHERFDVGVEVGRWSNKDNAADETTTRLDVRTIFRPLSSLGFNLIGGFGWVGYSAGELDFSSVAVSAGAGWDIPIVNRWTVGARVLTDVWSYGSIVSQQLGDASTDVSISVARLEVVLGRR